MISPLDRGIAILQMAGAANAVAFAVWVALNNFSALLGLMLFVILTIYGLGFIGAILLWKRLRLGAVLSVVHWMVVMPAFAVLNVMAYDVDNIFHVDLILVLGESTVRFMLNWGVSVFTLTFRVGGVTETTLGIDLVAMAVIGYLAAHWNELDRLVRAPSPASHRAPEAVAPSGDS